MSSYLFYYFCQLTLDRIMVGCQPQNLVLNLHINISGTAGATLRSRITFVTFWALWSIFPLGSLWNGQPSGSLRSILPLRSLWTGLPSGTRQTLWFCGACFTFRSRRTHRFACRLASITDLAVYIPHYTSSSKFFFINFWGLS